MPNRPFQGPLERRVQWLLFAPLAVLLASASWLSVAYAETPTPVSCTVTSKISICLSQSAIATIIAARPTPTRVPPTPTRVPPAPDFRAPICTGNLCTNQATLNRRATQTAVAKLATPTPIRRKA